MQQPSFEAKAPALEVCVVIVLCFGWFILLAMQVLQANPGTDAVEGISDNSLFGLIVTECVLGACALAYLHRRGYSVPALLPRPTWRGCAWGLLLCVVGLLAAWLVQSELLDPGWLAAPRPTDKMVQESTASLPMVLSLSAVNGLYEETFLLGYLQRFQAAAGPAFAIGLSTLVRLLYHVYQGPVGAVSVLVFGLVLGLWYWRTRMLWPAVVAHMLVDAWAMA